jgi:hypothetical protein
MVHVRKAGHASTAAAMGVVIMGIAVSAKIARLGLGALPGRATRA